MPLTPRLGIYYPVLADDPDVPGDMHLMAESIENAAIGWVAGDFKFSFQPVDHDQFILCDGSPRERDDVPPAYAALIDAVIGIHPDPTKVSTPDFRRRSPMGANPGGPAIAGVVPNLGALSGEERHLLLAAESGVNGNGATAIVGNHQHNIHAAFGGTAVATFDLLRHTGGAAERFDTNQLTDAAGSHSHNFVARNADALHNVVHPVLFGNWFIATGGGGSGAGGGPGGGLDAPADVPLVTANLAPAAGQSGLLTIGAGYRVLRVFSDRICRIRFYSTPAKRDADIARPLTTEPPDYPAPAASPNHGCMLEENLVAANLSAGSYVQDFAPNVVGSSGEVPRSNDIAYRIDNTDIAAHVINLTFTIQSLETA